MDFVGIYNKANKQNKNKYCERIIPGISSLTTINQQNSATFFWATQ